MSKNNIKDLIQFNVEGHIYDRFIELYPDEEDQEKFFVEMVNTVYFAKRFIPQDKIPQNFGVVSNLMGKAKNIISKL